MEIASAFVSILPSARGFGSRLQRDVSRETSGAGKAVGGMFGKAFAAAAGAIAVGGFLKNAVSLEASFSKTMNTMGAVANVPKDQLKDLSSLAMKMGADTVFSANESADAMLELAKGGISAAQIKAGALAGTLTLAAAGGTDLGTAATIASNAMNTFALKGKDMGKIAAALAGGANASSASVESLGEGLSQVGPGARNAGLSLQETVGALSAFDAAGIKGSDAGTSLKTMLANLVPQTDKAKAAMRDLGLNFVNADGSFKSLANISEQLHDRLGGLSEAQRSVALATIFGSDASRAATVLMNNGAKGIRGYIQATNDQHAAQRAADAAMQGTAGALEKLGGSWETLQLQVGKAIAPLVQRGALLLADAMDAVVPAAQAAKTFLAPFIAQVQGFFGGSGGTAVQSFGASVVATFQGQVLPILQQGAAVFRDTILPAITSLVTYVSTNLWPVFQQFVGILQANVIPIIAAFAGFLVGTLWPAIVRIATSIATQLKPVFDQLVATYRANVLPTLQQLLVKFREWQPTIQRIISLVVSIVGKLLTFAAAVLGKVLPVVIRFAGWLLSKLVPAVAAVIGVVIRVIAKILEFANAFINAIPKVARFVTAVAKKIGEVVTFVAGIPSRITGALGDVANLLKESGRKIIQGLIDGIKSKAGDVKGAVRGVLSGARNLLPFSPAKEGPFSGKGWTLYSGQSIVTALADGIRRSGGKVKSALRQVLDAARQQIASVRDSVAAAFGGDLFSAKTARDFLSNLTNTGGTVAKLTAAFKTLLGWGWKPEALSQMFQSGNGALILDLAANKGLATQAASQFQAVQSGLNALGQQVGAATVTVGERQTIKKLDDLIRVMQHLGIDVADALDGVTAKKTRKKKGKK